MAAAAPPNAELVPAALDLPPGPRGHWFGGVAPEAFGDPLGFYARVHREYGGVVRLRALGGAFHWYSIADAGAIERVLSGNHANYRRPPHLVRAVRPLFGRGVFTSEGAPWKRQRKAMAPVFRRDRLLALVPTILGAAEEAFAAWARAGSDVPRDLLEDMNALTLTVAGRAFLGVDLASEAEGFGAALRVVLNALGQRINTPVLLPLWVPTPANLRLRRARRVVLRLVREVIASRAGAGDEDLLGRLMGAEGMDPKTLVDEVGTLLVAGHDTMAAGLAWTLLLLARHPEVLRRVEEEIDAECAQGPLSADSLPRLELTGMAFAEALRLYPPAWGQARQAIAPDVLGGYRIPAGAVLMVSQWAAQRSPAYWEEPERFDPWRFTPERSAGRPRGAYFPFGDGPRLCIGRQLALIEGPLLLAALLARHRVELCDDPVRPDPTFTLRPLGLRARLVPR